MNSCIEQDFHPRSLIADKNDFTILESSERLLYSCWVMTFVLLLISSSCTYVGMGEKWDNWDIYKFIIQDVGFQLAFRLSIFELLHSYQKDNLDIIFYVRLGR